MSQPILCYLAEKDFHEKNLNDEVCEPTREDGTNCDDNFATGAEVAVATDLENKAAKSENSKVWTNVENVQIGDVECNNCKGYVDLTKPNLFFKLDCGHYLCKNATCLDDTFFSTTCQACGLPVHREALLTCVIYVVKKFKHDSEVEEIYDIRTNHKRSTKNYCDQLTDMANTMRNLSKSVGTIRRSFFSPRRSLIGLDCSEEEEASEELKHYDIYLKQINQLLLKAFERSEPVEIGTKLVKVSDLVLDKSITEELQKNPQNIAAILSNHEVLKFCRLTVDEEFIFLHAAQNGPILESFPLAIDYKNLKNHEEYGFFLILEIKDEVNLLKFRFLTKSLLTKQAASLFLGLTEYCYKNVKIRRTAEQLIIPEYLNQTDKSLEMNDILFGIPDSDGASNKEWRIGTVFSQRRACAGAQLCISTSRSIDLPNCIAEVVGERSRNLLNVMQDHCKILDCGIILNPL